MSCVCSIKSMRTPDVSNILKLKNSLRIHERVNKITFLYSAVNAIVSRLIGKFKYAYVHVKIRVTFDRRKY